MTEDMDLLAAEYALGTLDSAERGAASRRRVSNPEFDACVIDWDRRLAPLLDTITPAPPSPATWSAIVASLDAQTDTSAEMATGNVILLRRAVSRWRAATLMTGALAAGLAAFTIDRGVLPSVPDSRHGAYIAAVNRGGDMPALIVRVDLATHSVTVRPVQAETPPGKSLELWYVGANAAPKSMGLVGNGRAQMPMPSDMQPTNATFAVSVEPTGGSPTGAPTGPILYKGTLVAE